ncbi:MAG: hypothetical protein IBX56_19140, partial [Methylomicrobium sp.]|nr:hypothetical protein [Methylomicrobium sp.]
MTAISSIEDGKFRPSHEPTQAQKEAGNYAKPSVCLPLGLRVSIENPEGSVRSGVDPDGNPWEVRMVYPYGYILDSLGPDGDHVDCY